MAKFSGKVALLAAALALAACQPTSSPQGAGPAAAADPLAGHNWQIYEIAGQGVAAGTAPTLAFADGRVSGNGSCNRFMGQYQLTAGNHLQITGMASTMMACPPPRLQQEDRYLDLLAAVRSFTLQRAAGGTVLTLTGADGTTIRGRAAGAE